MQPEPGTSTVAVAARERSVEPPREGSRIVSLDGLRTLSVGFVFLEHLIGNRGFPISYQAGHAARLTEYGRLGVTVFFVISGYLITTILLRELEKTRTISLPRFYFRRSLRIFPAFYVMVAAVWFLQLLGEIRLHPHDLLHAATYTMNYHTSPAWYLGHSWSLSVEEQFYLLWPALLLLLGRSGGLGLAAVFVLVAPFIRYATWRYLPDQRPVVWLTFQTTADSIAIGCLLAGCREWLRERRPYRLLQASPFFVLVPLLVVAMPVLLFERPRLTYLFGVTIMNLGIVACLDWVLSYPSSLAGRILNSRPMVYVGVLSYSIYLWQELLFNRRSSWAVSTFPLNLVIVSALVLVSYYLVEKPFLRLRDKLEPRLWPPAQQHRTI